MIMFFLSVANKVHLQLDPNLCGRTYLDAKTKPQEDCLVLFEKVQINNVVELVRDGLEKMLRSERSTN